MAPHPHSGGADEGKPHGGRADEAPPHGGRVDEGKPNGGRADEKHGIHRCWPLELVNSFVCTRNNSQVPSTETRSRILCDVFFLD